MADLIIILILSGITFLIIRSLIRQRTKGGCGSCGSNCGCSDCPKTKTSRNKRRNKTFRHKHHTTT